MSVYCKITSCVLGEKSALLYAVSVFVPQNGRGNSSKGKKIRFEATVVGYQFMCYYIIGSEGVHP